MRQALSVNVVTVDFRASSVLRGIRIGFEWYSRAMGYVAQYCWTRVRCEVNVMVYWVESEPRNVISILLR
jgi:hypothetical protein